MVLGQESVVTTNATASLPTPSPSPRQASRISIAESLSPPNQTSICFSYILSKAISQRLLFLSRLCSCVACSTNDSSSAESIEESVGQEAVDFGDFDLTAFNSISTGCQTLKLIFISSTHPIIIKQQGSPDSSEPVPRTKVLIPACHLRRQNLVFIPADSAYVKFRVLSPYCLRVHTTN